jgi:hypothetical protein
MIKIAIGLPVLTFLVPVLLSSLPPSICSFTFAVRAYAHAWSACRGGYCGKHGLDRDVVPTPAAGVYVQVLSNGDARDGHPCEPEHEFIMSVDYAFLFLYSPLPCMWPIYLAQSPSEDGVFAYYKVLQWYTARSDDKNEMEEKRETDCSEPNTWRLRPRRIHSNK